MKDDRGHGKTAVVGSVLVGLVVCPAVAQSAGQTIDVGGWEVRRAQPPWQLQACLARMT